MGIFSSGGTFGNSLSMLAGGVLFADPGLLGFSMVIVLVASTLIAIGCLGANCAAYRSTVAACERWEAE